MGDLDIIMLDSRIRNKQSITITLQELMTALQISTWKGTGFAHHRGIVYSVGEILDHNTPNHDEWISIVNN